MIVNDLEGKKTIDTESGVWLTNVQNQSREHLCAFALYDGIKRLSFWTLMIAEENEIGGMDISYTLFEAPYFYEAPVRQDYKKIIQALLENFGYYYGYPSGGEENMRCRVTIDPKFSIPLDAWENGNG